MEFGENKDVFYTLTFFMFFFRQRVLIDHKNVFAGWWGLVEWRK
jgi:hypothetical protein